MKCKFCSREILNPGGLAKHQIHCQKNPDRIQGKRSPNAGVRRGNIPWNRGKKVGRNACWDEKYPLESVLVENSTYARRALKKRLRAQNLIKYECAICGSDEMWHGKIMPLILDHINGVNNDNRIENLRFVCSNCDSQLPTYKSRNRK
jgi:hypothetical protein